MFILTTVSVVMYSFFLTVRYLTLFLMFLKVLISSSELYLRWIRTFDLSKSAKFVPYVIYF